MFRITNLIDRLRRDERGLTTVEYVIALCLVGAVGVGLWSNFGETIRDRVEAADALIGDETATGLNGGGSAEEGG